MGVGQGAELTRWVLSEVEHMTWKGPVRPEGPATVSYTVNSCSGLERSLASFSLQRESPSRALSGGSSMGKER